MLLELLEYSNSRNEFELILASVKKRVKNIEKKLNDDIGKDLVALLSIVDKDLKKIEKSI